MINKIRNTLLLLFLLFAIVGCVDKSDEKVCLISDFSSLDSLYTVQKGPNSKSFLVENYSKSQLKCIDNHFCENVNYQEDSAKYYYYFRKSSITNNSNIKQNNDDLYDTSRRKDFIVKYIVYSNGTISKAYHGLKEYNASYSDFFCEE